MNGGKTIMRHQIRPYAISHADLDELDSNQRYDMRIGKFDSGTACIRRGLTADQVRMHYDPTTQNFIAPSI